MVKLVLSRKSSTTFTDKHREAIHIVSDRMLGAIHHSVYNLKHISIQKARLLEQI